MMYFFPLVKHHGCAKCCKYILGTCYQYATRVKKPVLQRAEVVAAAAAVSAVPATADNFGHAPSKIFNDKNTQCSNINNNSESWQNDKHTFQMPGISNNASHLMTADAPGDQESEKCHGDFPLNSFRDCVIVFQKPNKYFISPEFKDYDSQNEFLINLKKTYEESETLSVSNLHKGKNVESNEQVTIVDAVHLDWHQQVYNLKLLPQYYMSLAKIRLTGLVVLTTIAGYGLASAPFEPLTFLCVVAGTGFTSAAANAVNQFLEVPYDSQMARTKNRVLVRGLLTPLHSIAFATCSAVIGLSILYCGVNELTTALGAANLALYTSVYTPMKRCSILNTWVGSVVGAVPPLMGWAACTGSLSADALLMGAILYSWQFPHFNALSWNLRPDYSRAGYRMMSVINPKLCRRTALRHSIAILVLCTVSPLLDLTTWAFAIDSFPLNCYLIFRAWQFHQNADSQSSRKLFRLSLIHLPVLMLLLFIGKKHAKGDKCDQQL